MLRNRYGNLWVCCDLKSWGKTPLADQETHNARKLAHERFDRIWKWEILSRSDAYSMLAWHLGLDKDECHMATMKLDDLKKVISFCSRHLNEIEADIVKWEIELENE